MTANDLSGIVRGIGPVIRDYVGASLSGFQERLKAIEERPVRDGVDGTHGRDGKDADVSLILELKAELVLCRDEIATLKASQPVTSALEASLKTFVVDAIAAIPAANNGADGHDGKDGTSVSLDDLAPVVVAAVEKAVSALPVPNDGRDGKDGTSVSLDDLAPVVVAAVEKAVSALPVPNDGRDGKDGLSVDPADVESLVITQVTKAIDAIPTPQDGKDGTNGASVTLEDVQPLIGAEVQKQFNALPKPKDPVGLLGALIDRSGRLVLTLSDGTTKELGTVVGKDVDVADVERIIREQVDKWPKPKDGIDGLGFDDMDVVYDDCGRMSLRFMRCDVVKTFRVPGQVDRGVYKAGTAYEQGDGVTWGGSFWIAQEPTQARPGDASLESRAWRLAVKKGNDGKQGAPGEKGLDGRPGRDGVDRRYA